MNKPMAGCLGPDSEILAQQHVPAERLTAALEIGEVVLRGGMFVTDDTVPVSDEDRALQGTLSRITPSITHHFGRWVVGGGQEQAEPTPDTPATLAVNSNPRNVLAKFMRRSAVTVTSLEQQK